MNAARWRPQPRLMAVGSQGWAYLRAMERRAKRRKWMFAGMVVVAMVVGILLGGLL